MAETQVSQDELGAQATTAAAPPARSTAPTETLETTRGRIGRALAAWNLRERVRRYVRSRRWASRWERPPEIVTDPPGARVVVLAPHMDDEVIGCGGTLYKLASRGSRVSVIFLTDGRYGDRDLATMDMAERAERERELVRVRREEAGRAAEVIGIRSIDCLGIEDSKLASTAAVSERVRELLRGMAPDVVFVPFFLEDHADHRATADVLADAVRGEAFTFECFVYEVWTPLFPNCVVDITDAFEVKARALSAYKSQLKDRDFLRVARGLNAYRSMLIDGRGYAEAFWRCPVSEFVRAKDAW